MQGRNNKRSAVTVATCPADNATVLPGVRWTGQRVGWTIACAVTAAYVIVLARFSPLPLQDLPTHIARAVVMDDLIFHGGSHFGDVYQYRFLFIPYVLGDLIFTCAVELFGPKNGTAVWTAMVVLSLPCALIFYLRMTGLAQRCRPLLFLLGLYLGTDWCFTMGFLNFRAALAMTLVTLGLVEHLRERPSAGAFVIYAAAVLLDYTMHLSTALFLSAALGVTVLLRVHGRRTKWRIECLLAMPLIAVLLWNFGVADTYRIPSDLVENSYYWGTLHDKLWRLDSNFLRYSPRQDVLLLGMLAACLMLQTGGIARNQLTNPRLHERVALAFTFIALYFALPLAYSDAGYVDGRALPLASVFFILACVTVAEAGSPVGRTRMAVALALATALSIVNLLGLTAVFVKNDAFFAQYRAVVAAIPLRARVLPIVTQGPQGNVGPLLHVHSFVTIDRFAVNPYEFAGDSGSTVRYFRYIKRPYDPPADWYRRKTTPQIRWESVACDYDYLLVTRPYSAERLALPTRLVRFNDAAALLAIDKRACPHVPDSINVARVNDENR